MPARGGSIFQRAGSGGSRSGGPTRWVEVPEGDTSEGFAERLLERGVVVAPGSYLGESGEGYVRLALVPDDEACRCEEAGASSAVEHIACVQRIFANVKFGCEAAWRIKDGKLHVCSEYDGVRGWRHRHPQTRPFPPTRHRLTSR